MAEVTLGDDVEGSRVVKDVVVEGEVTAGKWIMLSAEGSMKMGKGTNLGMRSTPCSLRLVQLAFLTSAAALVNSSADSLPAQ